MALIELGDHVGARTTLQHFVDENAARVGRELKTLTGSLSAILDDAGIEYLYRDYVEEWIRVSA